MHPFITKNLFLLFWLALFVGFLLTVLPAYGAIDLTCPTQKDPGGSSPYPWCAAGKGGGIAGLVKEFFYIAIGVSGVVAFGVLVYGSILWTVSGVVNTKTGALDLIKGALWGIALLAIGYLILVTINPSFTTLKNPILERNVVIPQTSIGAPPVVGSLCDLNNAASCPSGSVCRRISSNNTRCEVTATPGALQRGQRCGVSGSASCDSARGLTCQLTYSRNNIHNPTYNRTDPSKNEDYYTCL